MSDKSGIEWTDATWNPVIGCTKVSPGCDNCYAIRTAHRMTANPNEKISAAYAGTEADGEWTGQVNLLEDRLDQPLRWTSSRRIFVNSQADLFHDDVPEEFIARVFAVMALAPQHTFQILTKRHARMRSLLNSLRFGIAVDTIEYQAANGEVPGIGQKLAHAAREARRQPDGSIPMRSVLPNVWLGVSVENQQWADIRIPALLDTPAAVRFLSCEPLLGPVDLLQSINQEPLAAYHFQPGGIDWVIAGGESGPDARPMHPDWVRSLRDQCGSAGVAFHFKQWGEWAIDFTRGTHLLQTTGQLITRESGTTENPYGHGSGIQDLVDRGHPGWVRVRRAGKKAAGRQLDGRTWDEHPEPAAV